MTSADCTSGSADTCNTSTLVAACACQGGVRDGGASSAADYETTVCTSGATAPHLGICSDGDDEGTTKRNSRLGGENTALCVTLNTGADVVTNCGQEGGEALKGTLWGGENPGVAPTPQRAPGGAGLDFGAGSDILDLENTFLIEWESANSNGIRRFTSFGASYWLDWAFGQKVINGGAVSSSIVTLYCDVGNPGDPNSPSRHPAEPFGVQDPNDKGTCNIAGGGALACDYHQTCIASSGNDSDRCAGQTYCYSAGVALDQPGFLFTTNPTSMGGDPCPPRCGTTFDLHAFEQEELEIASGKDRETGIQTALNTGLKREFALAGDQVGAADLISYTWLGEVDRRCTVAPSSHDPNVAADGLVGRCSGSTTVCNPDAPTDICPGGQICSRCNTSAAQAGVCEGAGDAGSGVPCQLTADCGGGETCVLPTDGSLNQPGDYDDGGFTSLELGTRGAVGGLFRDPTLTTLPAGAKFTPDLFVPLTLLTTTGDVRAEFRDSDQNTPGGKDSATLGFAPGGGPGIGAGQTWTTGTPLAAFPGESVENGPIVIAPENPGTASNVLQVSHDFGPGGDQVTGCIGDSSNTFPGDPLSGACNNYLGQSLALGNSGADDPKLRRAAIGRYGTGAKPGQFSDCTSICVDAVQFVTIGADRGELCGPGTTNGGFPGDMCPDNVTICACAGQDAGYNLSDKTPEYATARYPTLRNITAGSARDLDVLGGTGSKDTDAFFKVRSVTCPIRGNCSVATTTRCAADSDCPASQTCDSIEVDCDTPPLVTEGDSGTYPGAYAAGEVPADCGALGDTDGDGVCDDGDGDGIPCYITDPGNNNFGLSVRGQCNPCTSNRANAPCDDNCPYQPNPDQSDSGGVGATLANTDGIGDECQCGDVSNNGKADTTDVGLINSFLGVGKTSAPTNKFRADKCDTNSQFSGKNGAKPAVGYECSTTDVARLAGALAGGSPVRQRCWADRP